MQRKEGVSVNVYYKNFPVYSSDLHLSSFSRSFSTAKVRTSPKTNPARLSSTKHCSHIIITHPPFSPQAITTWIYSLCWASSLSSFLWSGFKRWSILHGVQTRWLLPWLRSAMTNIARLMINSRKTRSRERIHVMPHLYLIHIILHEYPFSPAPTRC